VEEVAAADHRDARTLAEGGCAGAVVAQPVAVVGVVVAPQLLARRDGDQQVAEGGEGVDAPAEELARLIEVLEHVEQQHGADPRPLLEREREGIDAVADHAGRGGDDRLVHRDVGAGALEAVPAQIAHGGSRAAADVENGALGTRHAERREDDAVAAQEPVVVVDARPGRHRRAGAR
jgi:hypothetical protein